MDNGLWISWYNLPAAGRDAYISWLHDIYIPRMLKKPGILWAAHYAVDRSAPINEPSVARLLHHTEDAAVPAGNDYVLMFGAESAYAFAKGAAAYLHQAPSKLHADLSEEDRKMLAMRIGERVCITAEVARRNGPEAKPPAGEMLPSPCIQLGTFNLGNTEGEDELLAWFEGWRFNALGNLPGSVRIRHMLSVSGWAKHGVLYEFASRKARDAHFPNLRKMYPAEGAWSDKLVPKLLHAPDSPFLGSRIWPPIA